MVHKWMYGYEPECNGCRYRVLWGQDEDTIFICAGKDRCDCCRPDEDSSDATKGSE